MTHYRKQIRKWHLDKDESVYSREMNEWVAQSSDLLWPEVTVYNSQWNNLTAPKRIHTRGHERQRNPNEIEFASRLLSNWKLTHKACHVESASFLIDFTFPAVCLSCAFSEETSRLILSHYLSLWWLLHLFLPLSQRCVRCTAPWERLLSSSALENGTPSGFLKGRSISSRCWRRPLHTSPDNQIAASQARQSDTRVINI